MLKIGLAHTMLLDFASPPRRKRYSDNLILALAPFDFGLQLIGLMDRLGVLDATQREWLDRARAVEEANDLV
jgi:hypothetical protein